MGGGSLRELGPTKTLANTFPHSLHPPGYVGFFSHPRDRLHAYRYFKPGTMYWNQGAWRRLGILEGGVALGTMCAPHNRPTLAPTPPSEWLFLTVLNSVTWRRSATG